MTDFSGNLLLALNQQVDELLKSYVASGYQAMSSYLLKPFSLMATIFLVFQGIRLALGDLALDMGWVVKSCIRLGLVFTLIGSGGWEYVSQYLYEGLNQLSSTLGGLLLSGHSGSMDSGGNSAISGLGGLLEKFSSLGLSFFKLGHLYNLLPCFDALLVWAVGFLSAAVGVFEIVLAKVLFSLLLLIFPLLLIGLLFEPFSGLIDRWCGLVVGVFLLQILVYGVIAFDVSVANWWIERFDLSPANLGNGSALSLVILGVIAVGLMAKISGLAYELGSGVSGVMSQRQLGQQVRQLLWGSVFDRRSALG